jgi:hypothetical protein
MYRAFIIVIYIGVRWEYFTVRKLGVAECLIILSAVKYVYTYRTTFV